MGAERSSSSRSPAATRRRRCGKPRRPPPRLCHSSGIIEILQALPLFVMALVMAAALGPSLRNTIIAISVALIPAPARVVRASTLSLREQPFVEAARAVGMSETRIAISHVLHRIRWRL